MVWSRTTAEQAAEIRRDKTLFTRSSSPTLGRGHLFTVLDQRAANGDATAARLAGLGSLAFATPPYAPTVGELDALVAELKKARFTPDPFTHSP